MSTNPETTEDLIESLQNPTTGRRYFRRVGLDPWVFGTAAVLAIRLFVARISRGRSIRLFVTGVLVVPSVISLMWFAIFGGGAIGIQERAERGEAGEDKLAEVVDGVPDINFDLILFDMLNALPVSGWAAVVLMIVMGALSENGAEEPTRRSVIFWGTATGAVAAVMLLLGVSIWMTRRLGRLLPLCRTSGSKAHDPNHFITRSVRVVSFRMRRRGSGAATLTSRGAVPR